MDLVSFFEKKLVRSGTWTVLLLFAISCSSPGRPPVRGAGLGDVFQELRIRGGKVESPALQVGRLRIPLEGPLFEVELAGLGRLGPEDFDGTGVEGLGTTRVEARFAGKEVPLEVVVTFRVRLEDPSFEKTLRIRWLGLPRRAPRLERALVQVLPWKAGAPRAGPGRPWTRPGLCAALAVPWGRGRLEGGRLYLEERPRVSLAGGWWRSSPVVLCPSGPTPAELAFLRWTAHERGGREIRLFYRSAEGKEKVPGKLGGFPLLPLVVWDGKDLAGRFSPKGPWKGGAGKERESRRKGKSGWKGAVCLAFPPGTRAGSPFFRKALQVALAGGIRPGAVVLAGVDSRSDPFALRDALALCRALSGERRVFLSWDRKGGISPFWQVLSDGQDGLRPGEDGPLLGQALADLSPWRKGGEGWTAEAADRLVWDLARGVSALDLGRLPGKGNPARRFLEASLEWAWKERDLLRNAHTPFRGEPGFGMEGENWVAVKGGRLIWAVRFSGKEGRVPLEVLDPKWKWVRELYPKRRWLRRPEGGVEAQVPGKVVVLEARLEGASPGERNGGGPASR